MICKDTPPMGGWLDLSMGGSGEITDNLINLDIIEIIQFEDLSFVETPPPMGCWMDGWFSGSMGGVRSYY